MAAPLAREPIDFTAGDTLSFQRVLPDYPASGWSLDYEIRGVGAVPISFQSQPTSDYSGLNVTVDSATTAAWQPGQALLVGYACSTTSDERHQIYYGELTIRPNIQGSRGDINVKTHAQKMLANIEAVLEGSASDDLLESRIGETSFRRMTRKELMEWRGVYSNERRAEIQAERAANGQPTGNKIRSRMSIIGVGWPSAGVYPYNPNQQ